MEVPMYWWARKQKDSRGKGVVSEDGEFSQPPLLVLDVSCIPGRDCKI